MGLIGGFDAPYDCCFILYFSTNFIILSSHAPPISWSYICWISRLLFGAIISADESLMLASALGSG